MPIIKAGLKRGQSVRLTVNGCSMIPFIYNGDVAEIEPVKKLHCGDIVLAEPSTGHFVIHRIVRVNKGKFWLRGDAQRDCEGPIMEQAVMGKIYKVNHKGHSRILKKGLLHLAGILWLKTYPLSMSLLPFLTSLWQFRKKSGKLFIKKHETELEA